MSDRQFGQYCLARYPLLQLVGELVGDGVAAVEHDGVVVAGVNSVLRFGRLRGQFSPSANFPAVLNLVRM